MKKILTVILASILLTACAGPQPDVQILELTPSGNEVQDVQIAEPESIIEPTPEPTLTPTPEPTAKPEPTLQPTVAPTLEPTAIPTLAPTAPPAQPEPEVQGAQTEQVVKKSRSNICHAPGTTYYNQTIHFTAYDSIEDCLASGARLPLR